MCSNVLEISSIASGKSAMSKIKVCLCYERSQDKTEKVKIASATDAGAQLQPNVPKVKKVGMNHRSIN